MTPAAAIRSQIIGKSPALLKALDRLEHAAKVKALPILITGETGTGKELAARLVHATARPKGPFVGFNCASVTKELMESVFFGHEKGAFSGAIREHAGLFEQANGGTLFLDEIGEMSPDLQAKLLRVLQEKEVRRVGSQKIRRVDVRIVTATHRNLLSLVDKGEFRADLYYRIKRYEVMLPPLRDRGSDILLLARHFLKINKTTKRLTREAVSLLLTYAWPGNIRELEGVIQVLAVCPVKTIQCSHLINLHPLLKQDSNGSALSRKQRILQIVENLETASHEQINEKMALSTSTLYRTLNQMVTAGILQRSGAGRYTRYSPGQSSTKNSTPNTRKKIALRYIRRTGRITRQQYSEQTGTSSRTAARDLSLLVEEGKLKRDDQTGRAAGYILSEIAANTSLSR